MKESKFKHTKNGFAHCDNCGEVTNHTKQADVKVNGKIVKTKIRCDICWTVRYIERNVR